MLSGGLRTSFLERKNMSVWHLPFSQHPRSLSDDLLFPRWERVTQSPFDKAEDSTVKTNALLIT